MEYGEDRTAGRRATRSGTGTIPRQRPTRSATARPRPAPVTTEEPDNPAEAAKRPSGAQPARRRVPPQFSAATTAAPAARGSGKTADAPAARGSGKATDPAPAPSRGTRGRARPAARPVQAPSAPRRTSPPPVAASEPAATATATAGRPAQAAAAAGARAAQKMPFLLLVCGLLGGAMASALGITVTLSSGSFQITELQQQDTQLAQHSQYLQETVNRERSAAVITQEAYKLGMRPIGLIRYLNLNNGQIEIGGGNGAPGQTP